MTSEEVFRSQWLRLKEEVVEKLNHSIARGSMLSFVELNKLYKGKMVRWEGYARPEGRWLDEQEDDSRKKAFLSKLHTATLTEVSPKENLGMVPTVGGAIGGGAAAVLMIAESILRGQDGFGWFLRIACILLCFAIPTFVLSSRRKAKIQGSNEWVKKQYVAQIEKTGDELAAIWR